MRFPATTGDGKPSSILLVEEESSTTSLQGTIAATGCQVHRCQPRMAIVIEAARRQLGDVLLIHLSFAEAESILRHPDLDLVRQSMPVLLVTDEITMAQAEAVITLGVDAYLRYPVEPAELRIQLHVAQQHYLQRQRVFDRQDLCRLAVETSPDLIFCKDAAGRYLMVNPAVERLLQRPAAQILGRTDAELFGPAAAEVLAREDQRVLAGERVLEEHYLPVGKGRRLFQTVKVPAHDQRGKIVGICAIARDLSEYRQLEAHLRQAQKLEAIATLAGGIAHEFNNLLQAVQGYADLLLLDKQEGDPGFRELQEILRAARRGSELTRQLFTFSRKTENVPQPIDLNRIVRDFCDLLRRTVASNIDVQLDLDPGLWLLQGEPGQLEQLLMNLATNSFEAMVSGGTIRVETTNINIGADFCRLYPRLRPGNYVRLSIADTGSGIPPEAMERMFDPFYTTKDKAHHSGLGLSIVDGIVKSHHGLITCSSNPEGGTTFSIYLPAFSADLAPEQVPTLEVGGGGETILVVDDEEYILALAAQTLGQFGYQVITAGSGAEALEIYRRQKEDIHLVLLDLVMPGMDGVSCLRQILALDPDARVIIASGGDTIDPAALQEMGVKGTLAKPYDLARLLTEVRRILGQQENSPVPE